MNDLPREKLGEVVGKYGISVIENPRRCEGLLRDYCGAYRREISVLTMALEERIPLDLLASQTTPHLVLFGRLTQKLCDNLALSEQAAQWAVHTWAYVLNIISAEDLKAIEKNNTPQVDKTPDSTANPRLPQNNVLLGKPQSNQQPPSLIIDRAIVQQTIIVSSTGGDFSTISEAIKYAASGSRLLVRAGIYHESLIVDKNIEIIGDGAIENIVIRSVDASCLQMQAEKAQVSNLTLQGRGGQLGNAFFAVDLPKGELFLENCDISSDSLSCLAIYGASTNPTIKNCRIRDGADSGVYIFDNARALIIESDIYRNANVNLAITQGANPTVKNSRIFDGENGGVVAWGNGATGTIENCTITNHRLANVGVRQSGNPLFRGCKISGGRDSGVFVQQNGYGVFEKCEISANTTAETAITDASSTILRGCTVFGGRESGIFVGGESRSLIEDCGIYDNSDAGISVGGESAVTARRCHIYNNGVVAVRVNENSRATVENSDLRGNRIAAWETEYGVDVIRKNNLE